MNHHDRSVNGSSHQSPLSVALITPGWPPNAFANGIIPYVDNIAEAMRADGHTVTVVAQYHRGEVDGVDVRASRPFDRPSNPLVRAVDILTYRASVEIGERRVVLRALARECRQLVEERKLQIVEMEESHGWTRWLQKALPIPVVLRIHGPWFINGPLRGAVDDAVYRRRVHLEGVALRDAQAITSPSLDILERTRAHYGLPLEDAEVIPPPTPMIPAEDRWRGAEAEPGRIVFVGRFDRHKGGDLVVDAFAELAKQRPDVRLTFAGPDGGDFVDDDGQPRSLVEHIALRCPDSQVAERIEYLGRQPGSALPAIRRRASVVVMGSRYDNFPVTALEAMALGCPFVSPRIGGIPEIVVDGVNGLLYEPGNAHDMAAKLATVLDDPSMAARLGHQAGLDVAAKHDPVVLARRIADYYRRILAGRHVAGRKGQVP